MNYLVIEDPTGQYREGDVVNSVLARALGGVEAVLIPVDPSLFGRCGAAGYFRRGLGSGLLLSSIPRMTIPLVLFCVRGLRQLHWRAMLSALHLPSGGSLKLSADSSQGIASGGVSATPLTNAPFTNAVQHGPKRWLVGGSATVDVASDGFYGLALYGSGDGASVLWAAVSQTA